MPRKQAFPQAESRRVFGHPLRVGLYARVSTHDQQTLPLQLHAMREYSAQRGWSVVAQIQEVGSGASQRELRTTLIAAARPIRLNATASSPIMLIRCVSFRRLARDLGTTAYSNHCVKVEEGAPMERSVLDIVGKLKNRTMRPLDRGARPRLEYGLYSVRPLSAHVQLLHSQRIRDLFGAPQ